MTNVQTIKTVGKFVVSMGVSKVVSNVIKATTPATSSTLDRVLVGVGSFVIGGMVTNAAVKHVEPAINDAIELVKEVKSIIRNNW